MAWTDIPDFIVGQTLTASRMNEVRDNLNIGHTVCTSTTRPSSPVEGTMIYESDTDRLLTWSGSQWNAATQTPSSAPATPLVGEVYYSSSTYGWQSFRWDGSAWREVSDTRKVFVSAAANFSQNTGIVNFNGVAVNTGNVYNTANGRVTAPYAGNYMVQAQGMTQSAVGYGLYDIYKNGSTYTASGIRHRGYGYSTASGHQHFTVNGIVNCAVNDYIQIRYEGSIQRYGDGNGYATLSVAFLG
jgi:hypothetical protein